MTTPQPRDHSGKFIKHEDNILEEHYRRRRLATLNLPVRVAPPTIEEGADEDALKEYLAPRYKAIEKFLNSPKPVSPNFYICSTPGSITRRQQ